MSYFIEQDRIDRAGMDVLRWDLDRMTQEVIDAKTGKAKDAPLH